MSNFDAALGQLFLQGPVWDGNLVSKAGRDELFDHNFVDRDEGWNWLTPEGVTLAIRVGKNREPSETDKWYLKAVMR